MGFTRSTIRVKDLPEIVNDPERGVVSLVGDHGGLSLVTGALQVSGILSGCLSIENEHGVLYLDMESEIEISEEYPDAVDGSYRPGIDDRVESIARITLSVDVVKTTVPGYSTPDGRIPTEEYVSIGAAEGLSVTATGRTGILAVLHEGCFDDPDPDGLLIGAVSDVLGEIAPEQQM